VGKPEGKRPLEVLDVGGTILLGLMLKKSYGVVWAGFIWLRIGSSGRLL
jgi:hypothetical protein